MNQPIRLGLLRLCDVAPVILAKHEGLFAASGLEVILSGTIPALAGEPKESLASSSRSHFKKRLPVSTIFL